MDQTLIRTSYDKKGGKKKEILGNWIWYLITLLIIYALIISLDIFWCFKDDICKII